jgi:mRNA-degrading endonuclease RelE of RelBE toxin-antitoxin system
MTTSKLPALVQYSVHIPVGVQRQLRRLRASLRESIRSRLQEIAAGLPVSALGKKSAARGGPPLRFYVFEGFRVSYQLNPRTRRVAVLELRPASG